MKHLGTLAALMAASPALAHHELAVTASTLAAIPGLFLIGTAAMLTWRKWRGK